MQFFKIYMIPVFIIKVYGLKITDELNCILFNSIQILEVSVIQEVHYSDSASDNKFQRLHCLLNNNSSRNLKTFILGSKIEFSGHDMQV